MANKKLTEKDLHEFIQQILNPPAQPAQPQGQDTGLVLQRLRQIARDRLRPGSQGIPRR